MLFHKQHYHARRSTRLKNTCKYIIKPLTSISLAGCIDLTHRYNMGILRLSKTVLRTIKDFIHAQIHIIPTKYPKYSIPDSIYNLTFTEMGRGKKQPTLSFPSPRQTAPPPPHLINHPPPFTLGEKQSGFKRKACTPMNWHQRQVDIVDIKGKQSYKPYGKRRALLFKILEQIKIILKNNTRSKIEIFDYILFV